MSQSSSFSGLLLSLERPRNSSALGCRVGAAVACGSFEAKG